MLSGFLITSLLITEKRNTGSIRLVSFWGRRARRLLPALVVLLLAMIAWAQFLTPATSKAALRGDAFSTLFYFANWHFIASGQGYFDRFAPQSPLLHTWSVAIEEQFYLIWPLLLFLAWKIGRWSVRKIAGTIALGLALASGLLMYLLSVDGVSPDRLYYGTDTRAVSLLLGCGLAALRPADGFTAGLERVAGPRGARLSRLLIQVAGLAGMTVLILCWTHAQDHSTWLYRGGFVTTAVATLGVLLCCTEAPRNPVTRFLMLRPLRFCGVISYGMYLYHWPIFQWLNNGRTGLRGWELLSLRFGVTFALAVISYRFIEQPIRRGALTRERLKRWVRLPAPALAGVTPVICLLVVGSLVAGLTAATTATATQLARAGGGRDVLPQVQPPKPAAPVLNAAQRAALNRPVRVLVEGDSLAKTLAEGLGDAGPKYNYQSYNLGLLGCGVARGGPLRDDRGETMPVTNCAGWPQSRADDVKTYDPDVVVLVTGRWEILDRVHDGVWTNVGKADYDAYLASELDLAIQVLSAGGAKVVLTTTPCFRPREAPDGSTYPFDDPARLTAYNELIRQAVARHPDVASLYDLDKTLCPDGTYVPAVNGVTVRIPDGVHISVAGGLYVATTLGPELVSLGSPRRSAQAFTADANQSHPG